MTIAEQIAKAAESLSQPDQEELLEEIKSRAKCSKPLLSPFGGAEDPNYDLSFPDWKELRREMWGDPDRKEY
jgi:hypothetical protein